MSAYQNFKKRLKAMKRDQQGNLAIMFAMSLVPMLLATGATIDYFRYVSGKTALQVALDAAALSAAYNSAGVKPSDDSRKMAALANFNANIKQSSLVDANIVPDIQVTSTTVSASAKFDMPTMIMQIAGFQAMHIETKTEVSIPTVRYAEVVLALDYSGSMKDPPDTGGEKKYISMRTAALKLIDDLSTATPNNVKFGLVPFAAHVYGTLPSNYVLKSVQNGNQNSNSTTWTGCTQDRMYPYNITDSTPSTSNNNTKWGQPFSGIGGETCTTYKSRSLVMKPLTGNFQEVKTQLGLMTPYNLTHIALGLEFGFHMLSPNDPFTEATAYNNYETDKVLVLLTDGEQTEYGHGPGNTYTKANAVANISSICKNIKAKGITIITIAYDMTSASAQKNIVPLLKGCASSSSHFFDAASNSDVSSAFRQIRDLLTAKLYVSK